MIVTGDTVVGTESGESFCVFVGIGVDVFFGVGVWVGAFDAGGWGVDVGGFGVAVGFGVDVGVGGEDND